MIPWRLLTVSCIFLSCINAKSFFSDFLEGKGPFKQSETVRFINKMNVLSRLQANILDVEIPSISQQEDSLDSLIQRKPDEIPYLFEGDMVLTDEQLDTIIKNVRDQYWAQKSTTNEFLYALRGKRSMTSNLALRWSFPIPFYINAASGVDSNAILAGVAKWEQETCVRFTQIGKLPSFGNALEFISGSGCWSYIGKVGSASQQISIGVGCTSLGTVCHEIGHALGFYHEQARYDRDEYVSILTQNIQSNYLSQFTKQSFSSMIDYGVGYDYGSVMHYDQLAFSSTGGNTIATIDPNYQATIGQRVSPSFADVKRINMAYCNSSCPNSLNCENGGYANPNNCNSCKCPTGLGGQLCTVAAANPSDCGIGDILATNQFQTINASGSSTCNYFITAPIGTKVYFQLTRGTFTRSSPCSTSYLEIKYSSDFTKTGARFCTSFPTISLSETNKISIIYKGVSNAAFSLNFRYDPTNFSTLLPVTSPQITSTNSQTTTTATITNKTSFPFPNETTTSISIATSTVTQNVVSSTITSSQCSSWSNCSAQCGGCGTKSRRCLNYVETIYCNSSPCSGGYCCRPFFYVTKANVGYCERPSANNAKIQTLNVSEKAIH